MKTNSKGRKNSTDRLHGVLNRFVVFWGVLLLVILRAVPSSAALTTIFSENMGTPSGTTSIAANTFENSGTLTYSGSGDIRNNTFSSGYADASGDGNVFLTTGGTKNFQIASISTLGFSDLVISFGAIKNINASTMSELILRYSIDGGSSFSVLPIPAQSAGTGTSNWRLISGIDLPTNAEGISDLRLEWVNSAVAGVQFRLDDIKLEGTETVITVVPEPSTYVAALMLAIPFGVHGVRYWRNRKQD